MSCHAAVCHFLPIKPSFAHRTPIGCCRFAPYINHGDPHLTAEPSARASRPRLRLPAQPLHRWYPLSFSLTLTPIHLRSRCSARSSSSHSFPSRRLSPLLSSPRPPGGRRPRSRPSLQRTRRGSSPLRSTRRPRTASLRTHSRGRAARTATRTRTSSPLRLAATAS
jgi:hypothetical protein